MTTSTPNLGLICYNSTTDASFTFLAWRTDVDGVISSNMTKIDTAYGTQASQIAALQAVPQVIVIPATFSSANYYVATGISSFPLTYITNQLIVVYLDTTSNGTVTLNINSLGTKSLMKLNTAGTPVNLTSSDLSKNRPYLFRYDGTEWLWVNSTAGDSITVDGTSGNLVVINTDNTIKDGGSLGTLVDALTAKTTPVDADETNLSDSAASFAPKKVTLSNLWTNYVKVKTDATYVTTNSAGSLSSLYINTNSTTALKIEQNGVINNVVVTDTTNGRMGVLIAPSYSLHVSVPQSNDIYGSLFARTITSQPTIAGNTLYSGASLLTLTSSGTHSTISYNSLNATINISSGDTATYSPQMNGLNTGINHYGSGTVTTATSVWGSVQVVGTSGGTISNGFGGVFSAGTATSSTGTMSLAVGVRAYVSPHGSTLTGTGVAFQALAPSFAGTATVTTMYGVNIQNQGNASVTNSYGLYLASQSGSVTSNYAIFTNSGINYFGDKIGYKKTAPITDVHIVGSMVIDPLGTAASGSLPRGPLWIFNNPASTAAGQTCGLYIDITDTPTATPGANNYVAATIRMTDTNSRVGQFWSIDALVAQSNTGLGNSQLRAIEAEVATAIDAVTDPFVGTGNRGNGIEVVGISGSLKLTAGLTVWANNTTGTGWWSRGIGLSRILDVGIQFYVNPGGSLDTGTAFATAAIDDESNSATVLKVGGTHTNIIDVSGATLTNFVNMSTTAAQTLLIKNGANFGINIQFDSGSSATEQTALIFSDQGTNKWSLIKNIANAFAFFNNTTSVSTLFLTASDAVGIGVQPSTGHRIETVDGAYCTTGGAWTNASSRILKKNIKNITSNDVADAIMSLEPIKFEYKASPNEKHLGFIAEDVPDIFASMDRKGLSSMDFVAALVAMVQNQQKQINELERKLLN